MTIKEIRKLTGLTQKQFAEKYHINFSNIRNWEIGHRNCPEYVMELLEFKVKEDLGMNKMYDLISERLNAKKTELSERQEQFKRTCNRDIDTACFEHNAINDLLIMHQLKSEIAELEHWETLMRVQIQS